MENPGPDFVESELKRHGHRGNLKFLNGDSHLLIPELFLKQPEWYFDLINVDGDHSKEGAYADHCAVIPRLVPGSILVFDDIVHPPPFFYLGLDANTSFEDIGAHKYAIFCSHWDLVEEKMREYLMVLKKPFLEALKLGLKPFLFHCQLLVRICRLIFLLKWIGSMLNARIVNFEFNTFNRENLWAQ